jgi:hypothetical protein
MVVGARDEIFFPLLDLLHIEALQQRHERVESSARVSEREVKSIPVLAVLSVMVDNDVLEMMCHRMIGSGSKYFSSMRTLEQFLTTPVKTLPPRLSSPMTGVLPPAPHPAVGQK